MPKANKGDFVEVEYTGTVKGENFVFDTTDMAVAKANDLFSPKMEYGPVIVCLGEGQLLEGLEEELIGKETGKDLTIDLSPEKAFGKKDAKLIRMIPYGVFKKQNIEPQPGMQVKVDDVMGTIKTAAGGRCLVDFNHPLSGRDIVYKVKINRIVTDDAQKIKSFLRLSLNLKADVEVKEGTAGIKVKKEVPKELADVIEEQIKKIIPSVKSINFVVEKDTTKK